MKKILFLLLFAMPLFVFSQENATQNIFKAKKTITVEGLSKNEIYDIIKNVNLVSKSGKVVSCTPENMSIVLQYSTEWEKDPVGRSVPLCVNANCLISDGLVKVFLLNYHVKIHSTMDNSSPIKDLSIENRDPDYYKGENLEKIQNFKAFVFSEIERVIDEQKDNYLE